MYTTLGAPSGARGDSNGVQSGCESRMSTSILPANLRTAITEPPPRRTLRITERSKRPPHPNRVSGGPPPVAGTAIVTGWWWFERGCILRAGRGDVLRCDSLLVRGLGFIPRGLGGHRRHPVFMEGGAEYGAAEHDDAHDDAPRQQHEDDPERTVLAVVGGDRGRARPRARPPASRRIAEQD